MIFKLPYERSFNLNNQKIKKNFNYLSDKHEFLDPLLEFSELRFALCQKKFFGSTYSTGQNKVVQVSELNLN